MGLLGRRGARRTVPITLLAVVVLVAGLSTPEAGASTHTARVTASTGLKPGAIKHVWLIILENKSYDATFTGLNQNTYLWKTLPGQGTLLTNYYGTGHFSMDNYLSMVAGQAPQSDTQSDCNVKNFDFGTNADIVRDGKDRGQVSSQPTRVNRAAPTLRTA
jgi:hypothetical protein